MSGKLQLRGLQVAIATLQQLRRPGLVFALCKLTVTTSMMTKFCTRRMSILFFLFLRQFMSTVTSWVTSPNGLGSIAICWMVSAT